MTYDETTLWTKFMQSKGVMNNFEYLYRSHRFDKRDLETYLDEVAAEDVILSAFDFSGAGNTIFGFKYWKDIDQKWQAKLTDFRNTGDISMAEPEVYCPHCQRVLPRSAFALNPRGQLHKHCRECEGGQWDKQKKEREKAAKEAERQAKAIKQLENEIAAKQAKLERLSQQEPVADPIGKIREDLRYETARQQIADGQANLGKTTKVCGHCGKRKLRTEFYASDTSEDGLQEYCKTCQTELLAAADAADAHEQDKRRLEEEIAEREKQLQDMQREAEAEAGSVPTAENVPTPENREKCGQNPETPADQPEIPTAPRLGEHDATMHYKANEKRITLNATLSAAIRYAGLQKCYISTDRQLRQFLVFNNAEGANVTKAGSRRNDLLQVCSASIVRQIAERFGLQIDENYYLHITKNLSRQSDIINVEVKQVRTREEYAAIVANREKGEKNTGDGQTPTNGESGGSSAPTPETIPTHRDDPADMPLIEFTDVTPAPKGKDLNAEGVASDQRERSGKPETLNLKPGGPAAIPLTGRKPAELLQQLIDRGHLSERDLASFLYQKGWELHEPVVVTRHKKFSL